MLRVLGTFCLSLAIVLSGYLAWQLWGTGLITSHAQHGLRQELLERIRNPRVLPLTRTTKPDVPPPNIPAPKEGDPVGILRIPRMHLDIVVVQGTNADDLERGPGHYPETALPWDRQGRVAIAGHRTTYLHPFWSLDSLRSGDIIEIETEFGTFDYRVTGRREVLPSDTWVTNPTRTPTLILTTCTPRFSATRRLVVFAVRT